MGMSLNSGGHLTHCAKPTFSNKYFTTMQYEVNPKTFLIDYDEVEKMAIEFQPKLIVAGASAYPRVIDFKRLFVFELIYLCCKGIIIFYFMLLICC